MELPIQPIEINPIEQFFRKFERNTNLGNLDALVSQFADVFMAAGPDGASAVRASDFALALPKRQKLFDELGRQSTTLDSISQTKLDPRYTLVETEWRMVFVSAERLRNEVLASSAFIVASEGEEMKIVFYLAHRDIMAILRDRGILPA